MAAHDASSLPTAPVAQAGTALALRDAVAERPLLEDWLARLAANSRRVYVLAWRQFAAFVGVEPVALEELLLGIDYTTAYRLLSRWQSHLVEREQLSPASVNLRTAALQSFCKYANKAGRLPWRVAVDPLRSKPYRDVSGPPVEDVTRILEHLGAVKDGFTRTRDVALLLVLFTLGLRRAEVVSLDVEDLDMQTGTLELRRKGQREKTTQPVPVTTRKALAAWLRVRTKRVENSESALFVNPHGRRLTGSGLYYRTRQWGKAVGLHLRPHKLRHSATTAALTATEDQRAVQSWGGWSDPAVLGRYDDAREDRARKVAEVLAGLL